MSVTGGSIADYYSETLVFLGTAGVIVPIFRHFKLSPVHGFLLAGILLGPFGLGSLEPTLPWIEPFTINHVAEVSSIGELGVVFLMFMIGLELSLERLWGSRKIVFGLGALQVVLCSAVLALLAYLLGQSGPSAVVLGTALSLSSTAIVMPVLAERKRLHLVSGRTSFAILLFQDLAVAPLLFMVSMLVSKEPNLGASLVGSLAPGIVAVVGLVGVGRLVLRPLFRQVAAAQSTELFMAACLLLILGTAYITAATGQSMALGAFIAGMLLAETEFRRQIEALIDPFKGLLLGLFFLSIGTELNLGQIALNLGTTLGIAFGLIVIKAAVIWAIGRLVGLADGVARETALTLAGGGEFAFVLLASSMSGDIVPQSIATTAIAAVTLSMLATPFLIRLAERFAPPPADAGELERLQPESEDGFRDVVLIAGYGRVGQLVGTMLERHAIRFIAIDNDVRIVSGARRASNNVYYGDATSPELLRRCGIHEVRALVVTMNSREAVDRVAIAGRAENAPLPILARAMDPQHAKKLYRLGVTDAVPENIEPSLHLSELVLVEIGIPMGRVIASIHDQRDEFRNQLRDKRQETRPRRAVRPSSRRNLTEPQEASQDGAGVEGSAT